MNEFIKLLWLVIVVMWFVYLVVSSKKNSDELRKNKQEIDSIRCQLESISKVLQHRIEVQTKFIELLHKVKNRDKIFYNIEKLMSLDEGTALRENCYLGFRYTRKPLTENEFNYRKSIQEMITKEIEELLKQN